MEGIIDPEIIEFFINFERLIPLLCRGWGEVFSRAKKQHQSSAVASHISSSAIYLALIAQ